MSRDAQILHAEHPTGFGPLLSQVRREHGAEAGDFIEQLRAVGGYDISADAYEQIEQGKALPADSADFLFAIERCLSLTPPVFGALVSQLAFDLLRDNTDARFAVAFFRAAGELRSYRSPDEREQ